MCSAGGCSHARILRLPSTALQTYLVQLPLRVSKQAPLDKQPADVRAEPESLASAQEQNVEEAREQQHDGAIPNFKLRVKAPEAHRPIRTSSGASGVSPILCCALLPVCRLSGLGCQSYLQEAQPALPVESTADVQQALTNDARTDSTIKTSTGHTGKG